MCKKEIKEISKKIKIVYNNLNSYYKITNALIIEQKDKYHITIKNMNNLNKFNKTITDDIDNIINKNNENKIYSIFKIYDRIIIITMKIKIMII